MGFFTRAAMDALMKTTHPEINRPIISQASVRGEW